MEETESSNMEPAVSQLSKGHKWQIRISTLGESSKLRGTEFANQKAEPGEKIKLKRGSMKMKTRERYKGWV